MLHTPIVLIAAAFLLLLLNDATVVVVADKWVPPESYEELYTDYVLLNMRVTIVASLNYECSTKAKADVSAEFKSISEPIMKRLDSFPRAKFAEDETGFRARLTEKAGIKLSEEEVRRGVKHYFMEAKQRKKLEAMLTPIAEEVERLHKTGSESGHKWTDSAYVPHVNAEYESIKEMIAETRKSIHFDP